MSEPFDRFQNDSLEDYRHRGRSAREIAETLQPQPDPWDVLVVVIRDEERFETP